MLLYLLGVHWFQGNFSIYLLVSLNLLHMRQWWAIRRLVQWQLLIMFHFLMFLPTLHLTVTIVWVIVQYNPYFIIDLTFYPVFCFSAHVLSWSWQVADLYGIRATLVDGGEIRGAGNAWICPEVLLGCHFSCLEWIQLVLLSMIEFWHSSLISLSLFSILFWWVEGGM